MSDSLAALKPRTTKASELKKLAEQMAKLVEDPAEKAKFEAQLQKLTGSSSGSDSDSKKPANAYFQFGALLRKRIEEAGNPFKLIQTDLAQVYSVCKAKNPYYLIAIEALQDKETLDQFNKAKENTPKEFVVPATDIFTRTVDKETKSLNKELAYAFVTVITPIVEELQKNDPEEYAENVKAVVKIIADAENAYKTAQTEYNAKHGKTTSGKGRGKKVQVAPEDDGKLVERDGVTWMVNAEKGTLVDPNGAVAGKIKARVAAKKMQTQATGVAASA